MAAGGSQPNSHEGYNNCDNDYSANGGGGGNRYAQQRRVRGSRHSPVTGAGRRRLAPPTSPCGLLTDVCFELARRYLLLSIFYRVLFFCTLVLVGSLAAAAFKPRRDGYMAQKHNVFNQLFVKWSWAWTMAFVGPFVYLTARIYSAGDQRNVRQQLARLVVATVLWYACTSFFVRFEQSTGRCTLPNLSKTFSGAGKSACAQAGGNYFPGFDISGHTFILIYCMLIMCEEAKVLRDWERLRTLLSNQQSNRTPELSAVQSNEAVNEARLRYERDTPKVKLLTVAMACLHLLWDFMLLCTVAFFHTLPHKVLGAAIGVACWAFTYQFWFRLPASPGMPGHGPVCYVGYKRSPSNAPTAAADQSARSAYLQAAGARLAPLVAGARS